MSPELQGRQILGAISKVGRAIASLTISVHVAEAQLCGIAQTQVIYVWLMSCSSSLDSAHV